MPGDAYRRHVRKQGTYSSKVYQPFEKFRCRVCGERLDAYHDNPKCQDRWIKEQDAKAKEGTKA